MVFPVGNFQIYHQHYKPYQFEDFLNTVYHLRRSLNLQEILLLSILPEFPERIVALMQLDLQNRRQLLQHQTVPTTALPSSSFVCVIFSRSSSSIMIGKTSSILPLMKTSHS